MLMNLKGLSLSGWLHASMRSAQPSLCSERRASPLKDDSIDRSPQNMRRSSVSSKPYKDKASVAKSLRWPNTVLESTSPWAEDVPKTKILISKDVMDFLPL